MTTTELIYLLPYAASFGLSMSVLVYVGQRRHTQSTDAYVWLIAGQALWMLAYILELLMPTLSGKLFWDSVQWLASEITIVALPVFTFQYTKQKLRNAKLLFQLSLIIPVLFIPIVLTDGIFHWLRINPYLNISAPLSEVNYGNTPLATGYYLYGYAVAVIGLSFLIPYFFQPHNLFRAQIVTIVVGILFPIVGTILSLARVQLGIWQDPIPFGIAIGSAVLLWGIYRYQIFEILPVGRDKVFEDLADPVVILDNRNMVIDINRAMLDLLGIESGQAIGHPAKTVFADSPIPIKLHMQVTYARTDTLFKLQGKTVSYELTVWPMYDQRRNLVGRIFISHDITALKELEQNLRDLNAELEQRVRTRTEELAAAYDTTLEGWAKALELRNKETEGHSRRVVETTLTLARMLHVPESELPHIYRGTILHDIGKMAIPDSILSKEDSLTEEERAIIKKHPEIAHQLLHRIPYLQKALEIPYCHHERWDGTGYPRGLKGEEIPLAARIFSVVDVWDAIQSDRPYKKSWPRQEAAQYIRDHAGTYFDPIVVNAFLNLIEQGKI